MCTAAAPPRQLALPVTSTTITPDQLSDDSRMLMDDLNIKEVHQNLFTNFCIEHSNFWEFDKIFGQFLYFLQIYYYVYSSSYKTFLLL